MAEVGCDLTAVPPGSPSTKSLRRKPVPTPRNTLKKPSAGAGTTMSVARRQSDLDSQGQTSLDSPSPDESNSSAENSTRKSTASATAVKDPSSAPAGAEDILAALEKIPGVGNLRSGSLSSSSEEKGALNSSLPSLHHHKSSVQRDESSHSLQQQVNGGGDQKSPKCDDEDERQQLRSKMLRFNTERPPSSSKAKKTPLRTRLKGLTSPTKAAAAAAKLNGKKEEEEDQDGIEKCDEEEEKKEDGDEQQSSPERVKIQTRPLPALPPPSQSPQKDRPERGSEAVLLKSSPEGQVYSSLVSSPTADHYTELQAMPGGPPCSTTLLLSEVSNNKKKARISSASDELRSSSSRPNSNYLTMTGTIKRGANSKRKRPPNVVDPAATPLSAAAASSALVDDPPVAEPMYDVRMNLTAEGLRVIEKRVQDKYHDRCFCGCRRGLHVFAVSLLFLPFAWVYATLAAFYLGTVTWYSVFAHLNEERGCCPKLASPLVLLAYPLWIVPVTLALGVYGAFKQVSWYLDSWLHVLAEPDQGFFAWFCNWIGLSECCPYQVILLSAQDYERPAAL